MQISPIWVLSAAHCTFGQSAVGMCFGDNDQSCSGGGERRTAFRARREIIEHESEYCTDWDETRSYVH